MPSSIPFKTKSQTLLKSRRMQLVQAAVKLFVSKGYERTTMDEIAEACNITKGSLYNYVGSKEDLIWLILSFVDETQRSRFRYVEKQTKHLSAEEALRQYIVTYIQTVDELQDTFNFMNHAIVNVSKEGRRLILKSATDSIHIFEAVLNRGVESGEFSIKNPLLVSQNIIRMGVGWAQNRWFLRRLFTLDEFVEEQTELILKMVKTDGASPVRAGSHSQVDSA